MTFSIDWQSRTRRHDHMHYPVEDFGIAYPGCTARTSAPCSKQKNGRFLTSRLFRPRVDGRSQKKVRNVGIDREANSLPGMSELCNRKIADTSHTWPCDMLFDVM